MDFRHTFGSHLAQKGESLYKIAALMGNSPEICRRHYAALLTEEMVDTVEFHRPEEADGASGCLVQIPKAFLEDLLARRGQAGASNAGRG